MAAAPALRAVRTGCLVRCMLGSPLRGVVGNGRMGKAIRMPRPGTAGINPIRQADEKIEQRLTNLSAVSDRLLQYPRLFRNCPKTDWMRNCLRRMAMRSSETGWNVLEVANSGGSSQLRRCLGLPPVKFINPRPQGGSCQVYVSNYGGGLVDGDAIRMRVECTE